MPTPKEVQQAARLAQNEKNQRHQDEIAARTGKREGAERQAPHNFKEERQK